MTEETKAIASYAQAIVQSGSRATIYSDGQVLQVTNISPQPTAPGVLVRRALGGKVAVIDTTAISAVVGKIHGTDVD
jgi:hypothetical protein